MLVQVQQWATLGSGYPESGRGSIPQGSAFDSRTHRFKTLIYIPLDGFSGQRQSTAPVRLRKEGSRSRLLKWQSITYLRICVMLTNEIRMRQSAIRVQAHREVEPNSSQSTWDVPRPVRFDSDVRKRAYCRSQQIGDHESNSGR